MSDAATSPETAARVDWDAVFESFGHAPDDVASTATLHLMVESETHAETRDEAGEVIQTAVARGALERVDGGYVIAGHAPSGPESGTDDKSAENESRSPEPERPDSDDVADLKKLVEKQQQTIAQLSRRVSVLEESVALLADFDADSIKREEFADVCEKQGKTITRTNQLVRKVSRQLDEIGQAADESWSTEERVHALRQYLVAQNETGSLKMDYNAVQSYFSDPEDSISASWASQLMRKAAENHDAFHLDENGAGVTRLGVDLDKIGEDSVYRVKNSAEGGGV